MAIHNWQSIEGFIDSLSQICDRGETGALHFVSTDDHAGRVLIKKGEIIDFRYASKRGINAVELVKQIKRISYCFTSRRIENLKDEKLPATSMLIVSLGTVLI